MAKYKSSDIEVLEMKDRLEYYRDRVRDAARAIRHCKQCFEGWISEEKYMEDLKKTYTFARRCSCFGPWAEAMKELQGVAYGYKKTTGQEYPELMTQDMKDFHKVKDDDRKTSDN